MVVVVVAASLLMGNEVPETVNVRGWQRHLAWQIEYRRTQWAQYPRVEEIENDDVKEFGEGHGAAVEFAATENTARNLTSEVEEEFLEVVDDGSKKVVAQEDTGQNVRVEREQSSATSLAQKCSVTIVEVTRCWRRPNSP